MPTLAQLAAATATAISDKTLPSSILKTDVATRINAVSNEFLDRGILVADNTAALASIAGANTHLVFVKDNGLFVYAASGTPNGTTIFAASGGGVFVKHLTDNVGNVNIVSIGADPDGDASQVNTIQVNNDGDIFIVDSSGNITPVPTGGGGGSTGSGSLYFTYAQVVDHGKFWETDELYKECVWEAWVMPTRASALGYAILDGAGGQHKVLLGMATGLTHATLRANFFTGSSLESLNGVTPIPLNKWVHIAFVHDGTNVYLTINGIVDALMPYTGDRVTTAGGSDNHLLVGDNNHAPFPGRVKQVRGLEGSVGGYTMQTQVFEYGFGNVMYDNTTPPSFMCDYSVNGTRIFADLGAGFDSKIHHGRFTNNGELLSYGIPTWVAGDFEKDISSPTPPATPVGAKIFDSFSKPNSLMGFWGGTGGIGYTEAGSLGPLQWKTGYSVPAGGSGAAGIIYGRAILYAGQVNDAWVLSDSQDADVRVDRAGDNFNTGLILRYDEGTFDNLKVSANDTTIFFQFRESGVTTYPASIVVAGGWTTLRVTVIGTTMTIYTDGINVGTKTIASNPAGLRFGLTGTGLAGNAHNCTYDNFTLY